MAEASAGSALTVEGVKGWLVEKIAYRLGVEAQTIDVDAYFDEFDLDSMEALILAGELEKWLGWELETTALWYHPTIADLAGYIVEESQQHGALHT